MIRIDTKRIGADTIDCKVNIIGDGDLLANEMGIAMHRIISDAYKKLGKQMAENMFGAIMDNFDRRFKDDNGFSLFDDDGEDDDDETEDDLPFMSIGDMQDGIKEEMRKEGYLF